MKILGKSAFSANLPKYTYQRRKDLTSWSPSGSLMVQILAIASLIPVFQGLNDVLKYYGELIASKGKIRYVGDNYNKMSPVGLELTAPILMHLSEEVKEIE